MAHFQNIRLNPRKGLKTATPLFDFGKINVVCGPNNSGKTTILECISDEKLHVAGESLDPMAPNRIEEGVMQGLQWRDGRMQQAFPGVIVAAIATQPVWFADEGMNFYEVLMAKWQQRFGNASAPAERERFLQAFHAEFSPAPKLVLIPAKRKLETDKIVDAFESITPDGTGVLNFLFAAKNKEEKSIEPNAFQLCCRGVLRDIGRVRV